MKNISVIVPARNAARSIRLTILSLASEADLIEEILVVDDGSSDGTDAAAEAAGLQNGLPVRVLRVQAFQAGAARNAGLDVAVAEWLYFLDADDLHIKGGLRDLLRKGLEDDATDIVVGAYVRRGEGGEKLIDAPGGYGASRRDNASNYLIDKCQTINMGSALIRRRALGQVRFPENLPYEEDTLFWARLLAQASIDKVTTPVLTYHTSRTRADERLVTQPAKRFFAWRKALRALAAAQIDDEALRRREALLAIKIGRVLYQRGHFRQARRFLKIAWPLPMDGRTRKRFWRYRLKLLLSRARHDRRRRRDAPDPRRPSGRISAA